MPKLKTTPKPHRITLALSDQLLNHLEKRSRSFGISESEYLRHLIIQDSANKNRDNNEINVASREESHNHSYSHNHNTHYIPAIKFRKIFSKKTLENIQSTKTQRMRYSIETIDKPADIEKLLTSKKFTGMLSTIRNSKLKVDK